MGIKQKAAALVTTFAIATTLGLAKPVKAEEWINPKGWPTPNIDTAKFLGKGKSDTIKEIPGKETLQKGYRGADGNLFNTLEYKGHVYGFYVDTNKQMPFEYTLADLDGDGVFEYKGSGEGEAPNPKYIMEMAKLGKY